MASVRFRFAGPLPLAHELRSDLEDEGFDVDVDYGEETRSVTSMAAEWITIVVGGAQGGQMIKTRVQAWQAKHQAAKIEPDEPGNAGYL